MFAPIPLLLALLAGDPAPPAAPGPARVHMLDGTTVTGTSLVPAGDRLHVPGASVSGPNPAAGSAGAGIADLPLADVLEAFTGVQAAAASTAGAGPGEVEAVLVNGDRVRGTLSGGVGESGFRVRTGSLGEVEVPLELTASVRFLAGYARCEDPPSLVAGEKSDRVLFVSGDRIEGALRSLAPDGLRIRTSAGEDRTLPLSDLLGVALLPLPAKAPGGLRVRLFLEEGSLVSGTSLESSGDGWLLRGTLDGKDRPVSPARVVGLTVAGGNGTPLSDLEPSAVEVKPYWGDDPPVLLLLPERDRALTLDRGPAPPLRLGGRTWLRGLSMFSGTTATWMLEGKGWTSFSASVGVDDSAPLGAVECEVLVDGKSRWKSGVVRGVPPGGEPPALPPVDLKGAKTLTLRVLAGPGDDVQDVLDWVRAVLLR